MKKADLEKQLGKKVSGGSETRGAGVGAMSNRREQAMERKRQLLEKQRRSKQG